MMKHSHSSLSHQNVILVRCGGVTDTHELQLYRQTMSETSVSLSSLAALLIDSVSSLAALLIDSVSSLAALLIDSVSSLAALLIDSVSLTAEEFECGVCGVCEKVVEKPESIATCSGSSVELAKSSPGYLKCCRFQSTNTLLLSLLGVVEGWPWAGAGPTHERCESAAADIGRRWT